MSPTPTTVITTVAPTLTPTEAPSSGGGVSVVTWVFFALFLFLLLVSRYLAKLIIALTKGLPLADQLKYAIKKYLEQPLFLGLVALFLFLSLVVFLPLQNTWVNTALYWVVKFISWVVIFFACIRVTKFLLVLIEFLMNRSEIEKYVRRGVIEFLGIVRVVALLIILVVLIVSFIGNPDDTNHVLSVFGSINLITATLVVMFAPVFRSLTGGLTVLSDRFIKAGQAVELYGIAPLGRVLAVQLRETKIKSFTDGSVLHIPNVLFLRYALVNGSMRGADEVEVMKQGTTKIVISFPISHDSDLAALRTLVFAQVPSDVSVMLDDDLHLKFEKVDVPLAEVDAERTKLMLDMMDLIHKNKIELRY